DLFHITAFVGHGCFSLAKSSKHPKASSPGLSRGSTSFFSWMAGTSPAMTEGERRDRDRELAEKRSLGNLLGLWRRSGDGAAGRHGLGFELAAWRPDGGDARGAGRRRTAR